MKSYIVRVYRPDDSNSDNAVGVVEEVGSGKSRSFIGWDKLLKALSFFERGFGGPKRLKKKSPKKTLIKKTNELGGARGRGI